MGDFGWPSGARLQVEAVATAQAEGDIVTDIDAQSLGRAIYTAYMGALFSWAAGALDDAGFRRAAELAAYAPLAACATERSRSRLASEVLSRMSAVKRTRRSGRGSSKAA